MIMAPVSLPSCNTRRSPRDPEVVQANDKKRNSVHFLEDASSTLAKRISLYSGVRSRSFSESWVFMLPEIPDSGMLLSSGSTTATLSTDSLTTASKKSSSLKPSRADTTPAHQTPTLANAAATSPLAPAEPDRALMASLASFLERGCQDQTLDELKSQQEEASTFAQENPSQPAGPAEKEVEEEEKEEDKEIDLVITVRDFAYPADHPYHFGKYPPPPVYEESDIEEEEPYEEEEDDYSSSHAHAPNEPAEERTSGQSRGLYDFDAENASELSFREGDILWIHCRQFPGWFLGEMGGAIGLVPENYVQML